jgi:hypothetical protein
LLTDQLGVQVAVVSIFEQQKSNCVDDSDNSHRVENKKSLFVSRALLNQVDSIYSLTYVLFAFLWDKLGMPIPWSRLFRLDKARSFGIVVATIGSGLN